MKNVTMKVIIDALNKDLSTLDNTRITNADEFHAEIKKRTITVLHSLGITDMEYSVWVIRAYKPKLSYEKEEVAKLDFNFTRDKNSKYGMRGRLHSTRYVIAEKYYDLTPTEYFREREREELDEKIKRLDGIIAEAEANIQRYRREKAALEAMADQPDEPIAIKNNEIGSICRRKDGRFTGSVCIGNNLATGKPIREHVYGRTKREAQEKLIMLKVEQGVR